MLFRDHTVLVAYPYIEYRHKEIHFLSLKAWVSAVLCHQCINRHQVTAKITLRLASRSDKNTDYILVQFHYLRQLLNLITNRTLHERRRLSKLRASSLWQAWSEKYSSRATSDTVSKYFRKLVAVVARCWTTTIACLINIVRRWRRQLSWWWWVPATSAEKSRDALYHLGIFFLTSAWQLITSLPKVIWEQAVSYTHLTLPTNREV